MLLHDGRRRDGRQGLPIMSGTKTRILTGTPSVGRKLVAVVYADMVGYSRLIGLDDAGTLERLRTPKVHCC